MNISKGHIYYIFYNLNPHILYIGSTFNELKHRWRGHKDDYKRYKGKISIHEYFDKYGIENFTMKLLKSYDVYREHNKDNKHLRAYEQLWINKLKCLNKYCAFQPLKKEYQKKKNKKYYKENKEKIAKRNKEYSENNKEQISEQKKEYQQLPEVKERIKQYLKEYRIKNKEKIKEYRKKKYIENKLNKVT